MYKTNLTGEFLEIASGSYSETNEQLKEVIYDNTENSVVDNKLLFQHEWDEAAGIVNPYKNDETIRINKIGDGTYYVSAKNDSKNMVTYKARVKLSEIKSFLKFGKPFPKGSLYQY